MHSVLKIEKNFSAKALLFGFPRFYIESEMPYYCIKLTHAGNYTETLFTVELQLYSNFFFPTIPFTLIQVFFMLFMFW